MASIQQRTTDDLASISLSGIRLSVDEATTNDVEDETHDKALAPDVEDDDAPPAFPSLHSAQRQAPSAKVEKPASKTTELLQSIAPPQNASSGLMAPPPTGGLAPPRNGGLFAPPSTSALTAPAGVGGASGINAGTDKKRKKVALAPGCSPLDWARLKNTTDLRGGVTTLLKVTPAELKKHNTREDAWSAFYGKVYNITPYMRFHPGGEDDLMRVAGRDGTRLFGKFSHRPLCLSTTEADCRILQLLPILGSTSTP